MKKQHIKIILITLGVHSLYFFLFPSSMKVNKDATPPRPMKIVTKEINTPRAHTLNLDSEVKNPESVIHSFLPKEKAPKKTVTKKIAVKNPPVKKSPVKKAPVKKTPVKNVQTVRGKLDKNVAKIKAKSSPTKSPPAKVSKTSHASAGEEKHAYLQKISVSLKEWLTLPEKGAVKLTITVQANGKIVNIEILSSESDKNLDYLKTVLPGIQLPILGESKEITFTITFCDD